MRTFFFLLALSVICGAVCSQVARKRGRATEPWILTGLVLGPLALPLLLLVRDKTTGHE